MTEVINKIISEMSQNYMQKFLVVHFSFVILKLFESTPIFFME